jgi:hypothetical protein
MNPHIRELANQCEGRTICECGEVGFNFEKFAELIVQECADYANWYQANSQYTDIAKAIKEHFGVEE